jgi:AAA domain
MTNGPFGAAYLSLSPSEREQYLVQVALGERPVVRARQAVPSPAAEAVRTVTLTAASTIAMRPVRWLWQARVALGTLVLIGGREGIGKSTLAYTLAADITRGRLPGDYVGRPKAVIVCATEDSWSHTIVPRLTAAGADLSLVYRVDVLTSTGVGSSLTLPRDLSGLEREALNVEAGAILLDPLMSRLDAKLDSHKDGEVRIALEPLVHVAEVTGAAVLGIIHVNKSLSTDPLTTLMASRAFAAVARAVLFVMLDPDDETTRLMGQPKNNLGSLDLPTLTFRIDSAHVGDTAEGPIWTGRINWLGESDRTIHDALEAVSESTRDRSATAEAADWLVDHLTSQGGTDDSASIKKAGAQAGHSADSLKRARKRIKATIENVGYPRRTCWTLLGTGVQSEHDSGSSPGESAPTALTTPTDAVGAVGAVGAVSAGPPARARESWRAGSPGEDIS